MDVTFPEGFEDELARVDGRGHGVLEVCQRNKDGFRWWAGSLFLGC